jgi:hypothetical protein
MEIPKRERLDEFFRRLGQAPEAAGFEEAMMQIHNILTAVEDELTQIPNNPPQWASDGRLYPPQQDSMRPVPRHDLVRRFRSLGHNTFIGENGSIEVVRREVPSCCGSAARMAAECGIFRDGSRVSAVLGFCEHIPMESEAIL